MGGKPGGGFLVVSGVKLVPGDDLGQSSGVLCGFGALVRSFFGRRAGRVLRDKLRPRFRFGRRVGGRSGGLCGRILRARGG